MSRPSPFLHPPPTAAADSLAVLHLKRNALIPVQLRSSADDGYAEGAVTNTRFGSFPHSTLIGAEWGSQIRASKVDTGSRGRKGKTATNVVPDGASVNEEARDKELVQASLKRKSEELAPSELLTATKKVKINEPPAPSLPPVPTAATPVSAGSGFIHLLQPTPETWTSSLDHRTQVVYTPDYSYILQRLRARPGDSIIEAGAGSGSFTHAAVRSVFNGYPSTGSQPKKRHGHVYSYEFHAPRVETLRNELVSHGLDGIVTLTHRDVCAEGFSLPPPVSQRESIATATAPSASAVFLDLPAPWLAIPHLVRPCSSTPSGPLHPQLPVHLCTFSPCIEQVMATTSTLRNLGWVEIKMVAIANKRIDVRRERVGLQEEGLRGVVASPRNVDEALGRLREVERGMRERAAPGAKDQTKVGEADGKGDPDGIARPTPKSLRHSANQKAAQETRKLYKEGMLVHRSESDVKTHTSYLVFAVLPVPVVESDG